MISGGTKANIILTISFFLSVTLIFGQSKDAKATGPDRVYGDTILIFPGEVLYFEVKMTGNKIVGFREKKPTNDSSNTLIVTLDKDNPGRFEDVPSMLTIYNPFRKKLFYSADIKYKKKAGDFVRTRVLPIPPQKPFAAIWSDQAQAVRIFNFLLKQGN